jgi:hypothetical protein
MAQLTTRYKSREIIECFQSALAICSVRACRRAGRSGSGNIGLGLATALESSLLSTGADTEVSLSKSLKSLLEGIPTSPTTQSRGPGLHYS